MPMRSEMNTTEKTVKWPTVAAMIPSDQARLTMSTPSIKSGVTTRRKTRIRNANVSAKASSVAPVLSRKAVNISSFDSAGVPVTPAWTSVNSVCSAPMACRIAAMKCLLWGRVGRSPPRLDEEEEQLVGGREEVAGALLVARRREDTLPRRGRERAIHAVGDDAEQRIDEAGIESLGTLLAETEVEIDEAQGEAACDLLADAFEQAGQGWLRRVPLDEPAVLHELVVQLRETFGGEVEQGLPREQRGIDPIGHPAGLRQLPDLRREPVGVDLGPLHVRRLDDEHDVVELTEVTQGLPETLDVEVMGRQKLDRGGLELQRARRV